MDIFISGILFVKLFENKYMFIYMKMVQFKLYESYGIFVRVIVKFLYIIFEMEWGEFKIIIKMFLLILMKDQ